MKMLVSELVEKGIKLNEAKQEFEKQFISLVLKNNNLNLTQTARVLGMHRNTLTQKIRNHKIKSSKL
jgi:DNA-binding NtrC family response regulator